MTDFRPLPGTDGYLLDLPNIGTELRVERLRRERGELVGELTVYSNLPGVRSTSGVLHVADFNLSSARARTERARIIAERANTSDVDWTGVLEDLCQRIIGAERQGQPAVALRDVPVPPIDDALSVGARISLARRHPAILFGDGGDLKSYLALYWATVLAASGLRVLFADWEFSGEDHRVRLERITGEDMPDGILYVRCERPMIVESDRLRRIAREERIDFVICDSVAFACDGPPEAAEVASGYFRGLRRLGVGSLNIAHVRQENGDQKPFGSSFWHNGARTTWYVKRSSGSMDPAQVTVGLFNRKSNIGPLAPAAGYRVSFSSDRTAFASIELADTDLADKLPVVQRMHALLAREGSMTMAHIAAKLDLPVDTVVKTSKRHDGKRFVRVPGSDGVYRIGLLSEAVA
jgi:AAA domain-containing protein